MAEIHITGQKMLKSINAEFQEAFPYLRLTFCSVADWKKATGKGGTIYGFDTSKRLWLNDVRQDFKKVLSSVNASFIGCSALFNTKQASIS